MEQKTRNSLGEQLAQARRRRGWKLEQVAHRSGRGLSRISEMETGRANSTVDNLEDVGNALGLKLVFVPQERMREVLALIEAPGPRVNVASDESTILDDVFIDDRDAEVPYAAP